MSASILDFTATSSIMPRIPFFKAGRSTPVLDSRNTDTPPPVRQATAAQMMYQTSTPNRSVTPGTIVLDTPPGSPYSFAPRIKVRDFAYVSQGRLTPARPPRPDCPLYDTNDEWARMEQKMRLQVDTGGLKRSHSRVCTTPAYQVRSRLTDQSTSCPTSALPMKATAQMNARSRASSHPLLVDIPSTPPPVLAETATTAPTTPATMPRAPHRTPEGKKRPTALKLHSSNLTPSKAIPITPTPVRIARTRIVLSTAKQQLQEDHEEIVESVRDGDEDNVFLTPVRSGSADDLSSIPFRLDRRISRSAGDLKHIGGPCHTEDIFEPHVSTPMPHKITSVRSITDTFCLEPEDSVSPPSTTPSATRSFENIPLPWSLVSSSSLDPAQMHTYLTSPDSTIPSPNLLPTKILSTCVSESSRLTSELNRLKVKYAKLLNQRDHSVRELQISSKRNDVQSLGELAQKVERQVARCDRVARQMYVCNDQIRQIEGQMVEHRVGVWQLRNRRVQERVQDGGVEILTKHDRCADDQGREPYLRVREHQQDRSSTISLGNLDDLAFPLPPTRADGDLLPSLAITSFPESTHDDRDGEDSQTTQTHETTGTDCSLSPDAILIYPPNHCRSASVPLLSIPGSMDLPHTPYMGDGSDRSEWDCEDTKRAMPGRTRGTSPLRFAVKSKTGKGRCQSMILARDVRTEQKAQKRESEVNTVSPLFVACTKYV